MNPYLHDLGHVLTRRVIIAVVVIVALGGALTYSSVQGQAGNLTIGGAGFYFFEGGVLHIDLNAYGVAGDPMPGLEVELNVTPNLFSNVTSVPSYYANSTSDSLGRMEFNFSVANQSYFVSTKVYYGPDSGVSLNLQGVLYGFAIENLSNAQVGGLEPLTAVSSGYYSPVGRLLAVWGGPNGPTGSARVVYCTNSTYPYGTNGAPGNCTGEPLHPLGSLSSYRTLLPEPEAPSGNWVVVELFDDQGRVAGSLSYRPSATDAPVQPQPFLAVFPPGASILGEFVGTEALLLTLLGLIVGYWSYAQPRLSTTLEPVLVRPVTGRGILLERFLAATVMFSAAALTGVAILDGAANALLGEPLPWEYLAPLVGSLLVAALGLAGLVFLLAHLLRTTGGVIAAGFTLVLVLGFFWTLLVALLLRPGGADLESVTSAAFGLQIFLLSPAQFPLLAVGLLNGSGTLGGAGSPYALAGFSVGVLAAVGAAWAVLPALAAYWIAGVRD